MNENKQRTPTFGTENQKTGQSLYGGRGIIISWTKKWMYVIFVEAPFAGKISFYLGREQLLAAQLQCWLCDNFESECRKNFPLIFPGWAGKNFSSLVEPEKNFPMQTIFQIFHLKLFKRVISADKIEKGSWTTPAGYKTNQSGNLERISNMIPSIAFSWEKKIGGLDQILSKNILGSPEQKAVWA